MDDADRLARALRASFRCRRVGRQYACCCPAHDDKNPSLTFWQGRTAVMVKCWSGCEPIAVIRAFTAEGVWPGRDGARQSRTPPHKAPPLSRAFVAAARDAERRRTLALQVWDDARPAEGTLVERYLEFRRGLALERLADAERHRVLTDVLRYHPACPWGRDRVPAMVGLMRGVVDNSARAIQRVFLDEAGRKLGKGMMLGPADRAAIKLAPKASTLVVCEGIETGLALAVGGLTPVWALGSAGAIERLEPVAGVRALVVKADHDASGTGQRAAAVAVTRWISAGLKASGSCPRQQGADYADVLP